MNEIILALITQMSGTFMFVVLFVLAPPVILFVARGFAQRRKMEIEYEHQEKMEAMRGNHQEKMFTLGREHPKQIGSSKVIEE